MDKTENYSFVNKAIFDGVSILNLNARNYSFSDIKSERTSNDISIVTNKLLVSFFALSLLLLSFLVPFMFCFFILSMIGIFYASQNSNEDSEIKILFNKELNTIEFNDHLSSKKIKIYNPKKIKIVARLHSAGRYEFINLSVDIVGFVNDETDKNRQLLNIPLVRFKYQSLDNAKSRLDAAKNDFEFLASWLNLPIVLERDAYYSDTNCKVY
jgi:hypothetical protein